MIGDLARTINGARNHPVVALVNRYVELTCARGNLDGVFGVVSHFVDSSTEKYRILFPALTKANCRYRNTDDPDHRRQRILIPIIGAAICDTMAAALGSTCVIRITDDKVQIGVNEFSCSEREDGRQVYDTRASFFWTKTKSVPHIDADDADYDGERPVFGRLHRFLHVEVPAWDLSDYYGRCDLYDGTLDEITGEYIVDMHPRHKLKWQDKYLKKQVSIEYVKLSCIEGMIALGPTYDNPTATEDKDVVQRTRWHVMHLDK
jgi:hypothetical protein